MNESILESITSLLGISGMDAFNQDVLVYINMAIAELTQMGVGPEKGLTVDEDTTWDEFIDVDDPLLNPVRTYLFFKVRLTFDPPSGNVASAINQQLDETRFRIYSHVDPMFKEK